MKSWLKRFITLFAFALLASPAHAQFSILESDSGNRLRVLGRDFNLNLFSFAGIETDKFQDAGGRISTYNYFTFATYTENARIALRVPFQYNTAGTDRFNGQRANRQELFLQDLILSVQKFDPLFLPWDLESFWEGRLYLPTSEQSQKTGLIAKLRNSFNVSKVITRRIELEYSNEFSYNVQSKTAYRNTFVDEDGFEVTNTATTKKMDLEHRLTLWGKVSAATGAGLQLGQELQWWNASPENGKDARRQRTLSLGPVLRFPVTKNANFILAYSDSVDQDSRLQELGRFLAKNTQVSLLSFVRF